MPRTPRADPHRRRIFKRTFAKFLRANATTAERRLWSLLRGKQLSSLRFRRQQPVGPYVVDFFCPAAKLIIELDGSQHGTDEAGVYDEERTRFLNASGYRVLRFSNGDVLRDSQMIVDTIRHAIREHGPLPEALRASTLPQGEGDSV